MAWEIELSVVMPCLNEAQTLARCIDKARSAFQNMGITAEVIVADNGSTDDSRKIAEEHGARVVQVSQRGYGSALQGGIAAAKGRFVIMGDADDSYDFSVLEPFVERLRQGDDLVMGNRFRGGIRPGAMPWHHRYLGNPVLTGILNLFFHTPIRDAHCGLRGFQRASYQRLNLVTTGMEFASEMVVKAALSGQKMSEVPIVLHKDGRDRPPHLRSFRDGWRHLRFLLLLCPLWLYLMPASFLSMTGLALMVWLTPGPRQVGGIVIDVHSMLLGAMCILVGYQLFWFWAFAKLFGVMSRIFPLDAPGRRILSVVSLERGLLAGLGLLLLGVALGLVLIGKWWQQGFGPLDYQVTIRYALWTLLTILLGIQTMFGSFLISMLTMFRNLQCEPAESA